MKANCEQRLAKEKPIDQQHGETMKRHCKNCKHNIRWFNPQYSKSLQTNLDKYFFRCLSKHFLTGHKLHKIFNENTSFKLSNSCMKILQAKTTDGNNKEYFKRNRLQKQNYATV